MPLEDPQSALQTLFSTWTSMKSNCIRLRKIATHRYENTSTTRTFHLHQGPKRDRSRPTTTGTLTWPGQHWAARNDRSDAELACPHFARSPSRKDLKHFDYSSAHMLTGTRKKLDDLLQLWTSRSRRSAWLVPQPEEFMFSGVQNVHATAIRRSNIAFRKGSPHSLSTLLAK